MSEIKVGERTHTDHLRNLIRTLAAKRPACGGCGTSLWYVVSNMVACGSTLATRLCVEFGHDPDTRVLTPEWLDRGYCDDCEESYDIEDGHDCFEDYDDGE